MTRYRICKREGLEHLLRTKKWNPYCLRHSAISADSDYLPEYALKKKVRWSMNSKQGSRYIKRRLSNDLKMQMLAHNGIHIEGTQMQHKPAVSTCPKCQQVDAADAEYCSKCSYPLTRVAYNRAKEEERSELEAVKKQMAMMESSQRELRELLRDPVKLMEIIGKS